MTTEIARRVYNMLARGVVEGSDDERGMQTVKVSLLHEEAKVDVERMQNYGFSSHVPGDSEVLAVFLGGGRDHGVVVAVDSRDARFTGLVEGEVAIYTDEGDSFVLKRDNTIELTTKHLIIKAEEDVVIETKQATLKAEEKVTIEAPDILLKGNVEIDGNLTQAASGDGATSTYTIRGDTHQIGNINVDGSVTASESINAPHGNVGGT